MYGVGCAIPSVGHRLRCDAYNVWKCVSSGGSFIISRGSSRRIVKWLRSVAKRARATEQQKCKEHTNTKESFNYNHESYINDVHYTMSLYSLKSLYKCLHSSSHTWFHNSVTRFVFTQLIIQLYSPNV